MRGDIMHRIDPKIGKYGKKIYSQNNEDGIIEYLCKALGISRGYFVEFGVGPPWKGSLETDGLEANCRFLRENDWPGLFMDGSVYPEKYDVRNEFITPLNINQLMLKYGCPDSIDIYSIDVDGQDFWIWMNLVVQPKIMIIEYNSDFDPGISRVVPYQPDFRWDCTSYMGASLAAICKLGRSKHYIPVYANGVNAFLVRHDLILNGNDFAPEIKLPRKRVHPEDPLSRPWTEI
jgi:hypothetical protein